MAVMVNGKGPPVGSGTSVLGGEDWFEKYWVAAGSNWMKPLPSAIACRVNE